MDATTIERKVCNMSEVLSSLDEHISDIFIDVIRSAMTGTKLDEGTKKIIASACWNSTLSISDEEVKTWI